MKAAKLFLNMANGAINLGLTLVMLLVMLYSGYALWDNNRVYAEAVNVQAEMLALKPILETDEEDASPGFTELLSINSDVCAWIEVNNTKIDFPVLQGESNLSYINRDIYGNFALAGSIFLDSRNHRDFSDPFSLLYGHHMAKSNMFGDLDLFLDKDFYEQNRSGTLLLPDGACKLEIFSVMQIPASEKAIFDPQEYTGESIGSLLDFAEKNSMYYDSDVISKMVNSKDLIQIMGLSTCSSEFTDARTVVLAVMQPISAIKEDNL